MAAQSEATPTERVTHTPGPWKLQRLDLFESGESGTGWKVVGANGETICDNQTYYPHPVSLPDARLIAAAPELLEALKSLLKRFKGVTSTNGSLELTALNNAEAAIRLASPQESEVGK